MNTRMCGAGALQGTDGFAHPLTQVTKACPSGSLPVTLLVMTSVTLKDTLPIVCCLPELIILSCQFGTLMCTPVYKENCRGTIGENI